MLQRILTRAGKMCDHAYFVQALTALSALAMLILSLCLRIHAGEFTADTYPLYCLSWELFRLPAGILLIGTIGAVCIEDIEGNSP